MIKNRTMAEIVLAANVRAASVLTARQNGDSLQVIANRLGVTKERVRQIEARGLRMEKRGAQRAERGHPNE